MPITLPYPSQRGQAPTGLLKLNICSVGCSNAMPSSSKRDEKRLDAVCRPLAGRSIVADAVAVPKRGSSTESPKRLSVSSSDR